MPVDLCDLYCAIVFQCTGAILCMRPANERRRYNVTSSLIGWAHARNDPWIHTSITKTADITGPILLQFQYLTSYFPGLLSILLNNCVVMQKLQPTQTLERGLKYSRLGTKQTTRRISQTVSEPKHQRWAYGGRVSFSFFVIEGFVLSQR